MLAGDFTAFASPACNGGRQVTLRAPYREQPDRSGALQSGGAESGQAAAEHDRPVRPDHLRRQRATRDEAQTLARIDYQTEHQALLLRPLHADHFTQEPGYAGGDDNILKTSVEGSDMSSHSTTFGATTVLSSSMVNALRFAVNKARSTSIQTPFFSPRDIGANIYSYVPGYMSVNVTGGFRCIYGTNTAKALFLNDTYQVAEDLTLVRGNHQFGFGGNVQYLEGDLHVHVARQWQLDLQRPRDRPWARGPDGRPRHQRGARRARQGARQQLVRGVVCAGLVARLEPRHDQRGRAVGAVLRPERRERRDLRSSTWKTSSRASRARCSSTRRPVSSIRATKGFRRERRA